MNTPQSNPAESLNHRFVVFLDGNPQTKPASGTAMRSTDSIDSARAYADSLGAAHPGRNVHIYDTLSSTVVPL